MLRSSETEKKPKIAVLSGGGKKGTAFAPAFQLLSDAEIYNNLETVIGSSVGGLTASVIAFGFNAEQLEHYLLTGGKELMDIFSVPEFTYSPEKLDSVKGILDKGTVAKGHLLYHVAQGAVKDALGNAHATFSDLEKKLGQDSPSGGKFRNLELTVTVEDPRGSYQIVCSPKTTPNMPIALAMRMTASLPIAFPPVKLTPEEIRKYTQGATEPLVKYTRQTPARAIPFAAPFPIFPPFPDNFYLQSPKERQLIVDKIRDDLIKNSLKNGEIVCTDGGVVDNLPIYLALKKEGDLDKTIALDFEEPWKRRLRLNNSYLYEGYQFCPMSELPGNNKEKAEEGKIYLSEKGYVVKERGKVFLGSLEKEQINLENAQKRLRERALKEAVLKVTQERGHTHRKVISQENEQFYVNQILNPMLHDPLYYQIQNRVHESRIPPSYQLSLLSKGNLLSFDTDDISAADFELQTVGEPEKDNPTPKTHDQKVTYLLSRGYKAGAEYLSSKGINRQRSFFEMYPNEEAKAKGIVLLLSFEDQIKKNQQILKAWEKLFSLIITKYHGEVYDTAKLLHGGLTQMRQQLQTVKKLNNRREKSDMVVSLMFKLTQFTEQQVQLIVDAKKECDQLFLEISDKLSVLDKMNLDNLKKSEQALKELKEKNPELAKTYDELLKLQESSAIFEELLSLIRPEGITGVKRLKP